MVEKMRTGHFDTIFSRNGIRLIEDHLKARKNHTSTSTFDKLSDHSAHRSVSGSFIIPNSSFPTSLPQTNLSTFLYSTFDKDSVKLIMDKIQQLLTQKENRKLEFKREIPSTDKLIKTIIAFANSQGGDLIIGISDDKQIIGIDEDKIIKYEEMVSSTVYDSCSPSIIPEIFSLRTDEKILLIIHIYPSNQKPHFIKADGKHKGTYVRVGSTNRLATPDIIENLEREKRSISFDSVIVYNYEYAENTFEALDKHIIEKLGEQPGILTYEKLKLIKLERDKYYLTNLGVWFSRKRDDYFPMIKIECARFKGMATKVFLDQATYNGDIIASIEKTIEFIKRNIRLGATIGEIYRDDRWEYPLLALREIIINAVVHRDYSILGADIKVAIFDDMIEVTSPGVLLVDKERLGLGYSELRNQNLGNLFKKFKIIEQWGTGYQKIAEELTRYPELKLELDDDSNFVQVRLKKTLSASKTTSKTTPISTPLKTKEKMVMLIKQDPKISREELANALNISINGVKQHILRLKKSGVLERIGDNRNGYWKINEEKQ
jgi:ATP-dependent DNA helicase RecG